MIFTESEAHDLTKRVLAFSRADSTTVSLSGSEGLHIRYAQNMATTSGAPGSLSLTVTANFGLRSGSSSTSILTEASLIEVVRAAEEIARISPENPEFLPPLGPQSYSPVTAYSPATRALTSDQLAARIHPILLEAEKRGLQASGYLETSASFSSLATTAGLFVYDSLTNVQHTVTARTPDGTGSGWAGVGLEDIEQLDALGQGRMAMEKAIRSQKPQPLKPGVYPVILEPAAVGDLVGMMMEAFDQREADEGRSFATRKGGGSRVGEKLFGANIHLYSDPNDAVAPGAIYSEDGQPTSKIPWVEGGILKNLACSRYWAKKNRMKPVPYLTCLRLAGGNSTTEEMIKQINHGLYITRFWYIRMVDPQTVLLTGLTRDGVFLIENGQISRPVQNFRFNQSPVEMLNHVQAMGPSVRTYGSEMGGFSIAVPPLHIDQFHLTSVSDAV